MVFDIMNMFVTILNKSLHTVKSSEEFIPRDHEVIDHAIKLLEALVSSRITKKTTKSKQEKSGHPKIAKINFSFRHILFPESPSDDPY
jgi:hypothetical protein